MVLPGDQCVGYTEVILGLTRLLGFSFAPHIKGLGKQTLYIFRPKNRAYPEWKISPERGLKSNGTVSYTKR